MKIRTKKIWIILLEVLIFISINFLVFTSGRTNNQNAIDEIKRKKELCRKFGAPEFVITEIDDSIRMLKNNRNDNALMRIIIPAEIDTISYLSHEHLKIYNGEQK